MKTVVISAGHGGSDPGASYNNVREKDANLGITLACRDYLNTHFSGHKLVLPRSSDVFVSLPDRRELTRRVNADLYVSVHNNAWKTPEANGFSTHLHTGPLFAATRGYRNIIHDAVYEYVATLGVRDRGKKFTDHWVTGQMPAPTVLMEYMFVSNPREAALLARKGVLQLLGQHTALGIAQALKLPKKWDAPAPLPDPQPAPGPQPAPEPDLYWRVVVGSFRHHENAVHLRDVLIAEGRRAFILPFRRS